MSDCREKRWLAAGLLALALSAAFSPVHAQGNTDAQQASQPAQSQTQPQNQSQQQNPSQPQTQDQTERGKPLTLAPDLPGAARNHRLILKDGSYQSVRQYRIVGDRVKYLSQDRGEWEELPVSLVDWDATKKWESEHAATETTEEEASPAMKEAEDIDRDEATVRNEQKARMPEVAKGLELPDQDSVFALDTYQGTPELVELKPVEISLNVKNKHGVTALDPLAGQKSELELEGAHSRVHLHVNDPAIYLSLGVEETVAPPLTHAITVNTGGGGLARNRKRGPQSAQSGFALVRLDERREVRLVGAIHVSASGQVTQEEDVVPAKAEVMTGKRWLKIEPAAPLKIGEYALVEILSPTEISPTAWDFREDPTLGDNRGSIGPIEKTSR